MFSVALAAAAGCQSGTIGDGDASTAAPNSPEEEPVVSAVTGEELESRRIDFDLAAHLARSGGL
ncbi:MAG: hypothetical protein AAGA56_07310 [Myxococcota bacterium]